MVAVARLDQFSGNVADLFKGHRRILEALLVNGQTLADQIAAALVRLVLHAGILAVLFQQRVKALARLRTRQHVLRRRKDFVVSLGGHGFELRVGFIQRRLSGRDRLVQRGDFLFVARLALLVILGGIGAVQRVELLLRIGQRLVRAGDSGVQLLDFVLLLRAEADEQVLHAAVAFRRIVVSRAVVLGGHIARRIRVVALLLGRNALIKLFLNLLIGHLDALGSLLANLLALHAGGLVLHEIIARIAHAGQVVGQHFIQLRVGHGRLRFILRCLIQRCLIRRRLVHGSRRKTLCFLLDGLHIRIVLVADHLLVEREHAVRIALHVSGILFRKRLEAEFLHLVLKHDAFNHLLKCSIAIRLHVVLGQLHRHAEVLLIILLIVAGKIIAVGFPLRFGNLCTVDLGNHLRAVQFLVVANQVAAGKQHYHCKQQRDQRESLIHVRSLPFSLYSAIYDLL